MKNAHLRWIFFLASIFTIGIVLIQVYWVRKAYQLEDKEFNLRAYEALRVASKEYWDWRGIEHPNYDVVTRVQPDYYVVQIDDEIDPAILTHILKREFENVNLITDIEFCFYDCMKDSLMQQHYISVSGEERKQTLSNVELPKLERDNYYFGVHFVDRKSFISQKMSLWYFSTAFVLLLLVFLSYVLGLILRQRRLREIQKEFISNMTHEFRTPLASIQLAAEVLKQPTIVEKPQRLLSYATIIDSEAVKLAQHVERVLQMAQSEKGKLILHKELVEIQYIFDEVEKHFLEKAKGEEVELKFEIPEETVWLELDPLHIENVLSNLIDNALKYKKENVPLKVEIFTLRKKQNLEICVRDNGIGISEAHQKLLFNKFYRVPTGDVHNVKGFGLGLNYVEIIVKEHQGKIRVESILGEGSTFIVSLPIFKK